MRTVLVLAGLTLGVILTLATLHTWRHLLHTALSRGD